MVISARTPIAPPPHPAAAVALALAVALLMLENTTAQLASAVAAVLLLLAGAIYTIVHPKLGLVDRLLGTRMVPR